nr:sigma-70 family RNA polymerase sigma factor [Chryseobacterium scophthalmum]
MLTLAWVDLCLPIYPAKVIVPPALVRSISGEMIQSFSVAKLEESAKGYLLKYLHYRVIDYFNSYKTLPSTLRIDDAENSIEITDTDYFEILEEHDISVLFSMIDEVVSQLPVTEQKIYDLRIRKNLSVDETAEILGLSSKTVSNKLSKAIGTIREQLTPEYKSSKKLISLLVLMEILVS